MNIAIRSMGINDIDQVYALGKEAKEFAVSDTSSFWKKDELRRWIADNTNDLLLIGEMNNEIVGFVLAKFHSPTRVGTIVDIFTKNTVRHQGIATQLESEVIKQLKAKGSTYIYALIQEQNTLSITLHEKLGFTKGEKMIWMELILDNP